MYDGSWKCRRCRQGTVPTDATRAWESLHIPLGCGSKKDKKHSFYNYTSTLCNSSTITSNEGLLLLSTCTHWKHNFKRFSGSPGSAHALISCSTSLRSNAYLSPGFLTGGFFLYVNRIFIENAPC